MPQPRLTKTTAGFTLLELLISISILGIMIFILMGVMRLGTKSVESGEKKIAALERTRASWSLIESQLQSASPLTYQVEGETKYYFKGDRGSLEFTTHTSIWEGEIGYSLVSYRLIEGERGKWALWAGESKVGQENKKDIKLLDGLDNLSFDYYYKDPTEETGKWVPEWNDTKSVPIKIRLQVTHSNKTISLIIPIKTGWSLNQSVLEKTGKS